MKQHFRFTQLIQTLFASLTVLALIGCVTQELVPKPAEVPKKVSGNLVNSDSDANNAHRKAMPDSRAKKNKSKATSTTVVKPIKPQTTDNANVKLEGDDVKLEGN